MNWFYKRLLDKGCGWTNGAQRVTAEMNERNLTVRFFPSRHSHGNVHLYISFHKQWNGGWKVRIDDLCQGGGASIPWNQGVGTLLMNIAIQCLSIKFPGLPESIIIDGEAVPTAGGSAEASRKNRERNYKFWSRFGLVVEDPSASRSPMSCRLRDLSPFDKGEILGGVPSCLSIASFVVHANEHYCLDQDREAIAEAAMPPETLEIPTEQQLLAMRRRVSKDEYKAISAFALLFLCVPFPFFGATLTSILWCAGLVPLVMFGAVIAKRNSWLRGGLTWDWLRQTQMTGAYKIEKMREAIEQLAKSRPKALENLTRHYQSSIPALTTNHLLAAEKLATSSDLNQRDVLLISQAVAVITKFVSARRETAESHHTDFVFGERCQAMYEGDLAKWADVLGEQFGFHLERLLSQVGTLRVSGNTSTHFSGLLSGAEINVGYIEFLREGKSGFADLTAKVYLRQGVLNFSCIWTAYKPTRAREVADMVKSLDSLGLLSKVHIRWNGKDLERIAQTPEEAMKDLLVLVNQPGYSDGDIDKWCGGAKLTVV